MYQTSKLFPQRKEYEENEMPEAVTEDKIITINPCKLLVSLFAKSPDEVLTPDEWDIVDAYLCGKTLNELGKRAKTAFERMDDAKLGELIRHRIHLFRAARSKRRKFKQKKGG
jgi:hypothetical protein